MKYLFKGLNSKQIMQKRKKVNLILKFDASDKNAHKCRMRFYARWLVRERKSVKRIQESQGRSKPSSMSVLGNALLGAF